MPDKKPMDDWLVGGDEATSTQKPVPPPVPPPAPEAKPPSKGPLVVVLALLALLAAGAYYVHTLRFRPAKVEEALNTPVIPKPAEDVAPAPAPIVPVVPAPEQKKTVKPPTKRPATKKEEEPVQPARAKEEPVAPKVEARPKPEQPPIPPSGIMLWSGKVEKNGTIVIDSGKSETGAVNGAVLPGVPVTVRVEPKGFTVAEPPSAATGWKRMAIHSQKKAHIVVTVFWDVKPQ